MRQVLFRIPVKPFDWLPDWWPADVPLYGFGMMLFVVFLVTTWMASRRARKEGINPQYLQDLAIWIFIGGIIGARIVYMVQYHEDPRHFFMIWQGGLVFYGSAIGGVVGYALAYFLVIRKHGLSGWQLADIVAPTVAVGLLFGRIGCYLNGCCYGNVACVDCPAVHFPLSAPSRYKLVERGLQTAAGFTMVTQADHRVVGASQPDSPAARSGLVAGDALMKIESRADHEAERTSYSIDEVRADMNRLLLVRAPRPTEIEMRLTVQRAGKPTQLEWFTLPAARDASAIDFGFTMSDCTIGQVDPASEAHDKAGLRRGDIIVKANDRPINSYLDLNRYLGTDAWPRGENCLRLTVVHPGGTDPQPLPEFAPRTLGLHPTQLYESISMAFLFLVLSAYYPLRQRDGLVMVLFILGYSVHRFLNEMLRNDTDLITIGHFRTGMTLSQNGSIVFFLVGLLLLTWLWWKGARTPTHEMPG
jgi:prolipoprotein diacylglyceryltransferase